MFVELDLIDVGKRIRQDRGENWVEFKASFVQFGQLQPIRLFRKPDGRYELNAGWRRFTALIEHHKEGTTIPGNPAGQIEATVKDPVPLHTQLIHEYAENEERAGFTFLEKANFIRRFHEQMMESYEGIWTQELTARSLNLSPASISHYLRVEEAAAKDESIAKASTLDAAVKRMKVNEAVKARIEAAKREDNRSVERAAHVLHRGDAREWIKTIADASIDFVNFDPPWGDNASHKSAENHEAFDDSDDYAQDLMSALFPEIFRILKEDRFCVFWHRLWASERMAQLATSFGFNVKYTRTPCIWYKPDKVSDQNRFPDRMLIEAYEPFFLLRKGDPVFHEKNVNNTFAVERVTIGNLIHPTEKPIELCRQILSLCTVPGELVIDPTAGSSAMLEAALRNNRSAKGCELSEKYHERGIARLASYLKTFSDA